MSDDRSSPPTERQPARGEETRQRLIQTALDLFGRHGYEAVSTRALADAADANIAAISYHFGSKDGLYRAAMEQLIESMTARVGGPAAVVARLVDDPEATREQLVDAILQLVERFATTLIPDGPAEIWARFVIREQMDPSPNFDLIFKGIIGPTHRALTALVARVKGLPPESEEARLHVFLILGQVLVFRAARATVMRAMNWQHVTEKEFSTVKHLLLQQVAATLGVEAKS